MGLEMILPRSASSLPLDCDITFVEPGESTRCGSDGVYAEGLKVKREVNCAWYRK